MEARFHTVAKQEHARLSADWGLSIPLQYNPRLRSTYGRCFVDLIEYANMRGEDDDFIIDVVRHEYAHALEWTLDGRIGHSATWRSYAKLLGCHPRANAWPHERIEAVAASRGL